MKISKAIEILDININETDTFKPPDYLAALKLGKEALKKIRSQRKRSDLGGIPKLPGEDPE
ncbi:hypothetical protein ES703_47220 [subsurface metagenome]